MAIVVLPPLPALTLDGAVALLRAERGERPVRWTGDVQPEGLSWLFPDAIRMDTGGHARPVTPVVVGPDGAPLWRTGRRWTVPGLREAGIEPAALLAYLALAPAGGVLPFEWGTLLAVNRRVLLDLPAEERERRILAVLAEAGVATRGIPASRLWEVVAPRIRRFADAGTFLRFLGPEFEPPFVPEADRPQLARIRVELSAASPVSTGSDLAERLAALATHPAEVHDLRRVLRWGLTGQPIGPPVWRVWDLLGPEEAHRRLRLHGPCESP